MVLTVQFNKWPKNVREDMPILEDVLKVAGATDQRETSVDIIQQWKSEGLNSVSDFSLKLKELLQQLETRNADAAFALANEICHWMSTELPIEESIREIELWIESAFREKLINEVQITLIAGRIAWSTRGRRQEPSVCDFNNPKERFRAYILLNRARFLFSYEQITRIINVLGDSWEGSNLIRSMRLFVELNTSENPDQYENKFEQLWREVESDPLRSYCVDVIIHAVWLSYKMKNQGPLLVKYAKIALDRKDVSTGVGYFRLATGHREIGDFDQAIADLDSALNSLSGSNEFVRTFSEQIIREREFVLRTRQSELIKDESTKKFEERSQKASEDIHLKLHVLKDEIAEKESESHSRLMQTVTFFVTAISFALGSISTVKKDMSTESRIVLMLTLGGGLLSFAVVISSISRIDTRGIQKQSNAVRNVAILLVFIQVVGAVAILLIDKYIS